MRNSTELQVAKKKTPSKETPSKETPKDVLNAIKTENEALKDFKDYIQSAVKWMDVVAKETEDRVEGYMSDDGVSREDVPEKVFIPRDLSDAINEIERGLGRLLTAFDLVASTTNDEDLPEAVRAFEKQVEVSGYNEPREDVKSVAKAKVLLTKAVKSVPDAITGPGSLRQLQVCFDALADAINTLIETNIKAPKVPKALDPEDPRQLSLKFASSRIAVAVALRHLSQRR